MATAEKELLSTTSGSVCEMWTGTGIGEEVHNILFFGLAFAIHLNCSKADFSDTVRMGGPNMTREFFYKPVNDLTSTEPGTTYVRDFYSQWGSTHQACFRKNGIGYNFYDARKMSNMAPNLTVNGPKSHHRPYSLAIISAVSQVATILAAGLVTFRFGLLKTTRPFSPAAAFGIFSTGKFVGIAYDSSPDRVTGSSLIVVGILGCCRSKSSD